MEVALRDMLRSAASEQKQLYVEKLTAILDALTRPEPQAQPDWDEIAARWLDLIRPIWYERLKRPRSRPLLLKDIRRDVLNAGESFRAQVLQAFESIPILQTPDERIAACIIGVPNRATNPRSRPSPPRSIRAKRRTCWGLTLAGVAIPG